MSSAVHFVQIMPGKKKEDKKGCWPGVGRQSKNCHYILHSSLLSLHHVHVGKSKKCGFCQAQWTIVLVHAPCMEPKKWRNLRLSIILRLRSDFFFRYRTSTLITRRASNDNDIKHPSCSSPPPPIQPVHPVQLHSPFSSHFFLVSLIFLFSSSAPRLL